MSTRSALACLSLAMLVAGVANACAGPSTSGTVSPGGPDRAAFAPVAHVLIQRCGSLDCHGSQFRNLRLYGFASARLAPNGLPDSPPETTPAEIDADYDAVVGVEPERMREVVASGGRGADRLTLVRKGRGTEDHKGGQKIVPGDPADVCLLSWLANAVAPEACANALTSSSTPSPSEKP